MSKMEKKLEMKNLRISFRTNNGTVKAVRDVTLDLNKGETLAIVGESGSGKSVTVRAVMGILAPNANIEGGEVIYDGKDLLKLSEEEFHTLRGNRLAMIFQDPLSSLNPIMRIGNQLTEAMRLNNKERHKDAKRRYTTQLRLLEEAMCNAERDISGGLSKAEVQKKMKTLKQFIQMGIRLEAKYTIARESLIEAQGDLNNLLIEVIQGQPQSIRKNLKAMLRVARRAVNPYLLPCASKEQYQAVLDALQPYQSYVSSNAASLTSQLETLEKQMVSILQSEQPDFFSIGYTYFSGKHQDPAQHPVSDINADAQKRLQGDFIEDFLQHVGRAIEHSRANALRVQKDILPKLQAALPGYQQALLRKSECLDTARSLSADVAKAIDLLSLQKDNLSYVFSTSLHAAIHTYFEGMEKNPKRRMQEEKDEKEYKARIASGKFAPSVIPADLIDTDLARANILKTINDLIHSYEESINGKQIAPTQTLAVEMINYIKEQSSAYAYRLTKGMAKHRALGLMNEVGIPEPRKRYRQYPFQLSGGQRQRIVIAIALAADPDILICDEPTTALDVTIQAQILELINRLKVDRKLSVIFITHDLGVVANMADRIAVMYAGKIVEYGDVDDVFYDPRHPYTWALLSSMPDLVTKEKLEAIPGTPPNMIIPPVGDAFAARNKYAMKIDFEQQPPFFKVSDTHYAATWLLHPQSPKVAPPAIVTERIARMKEQEAVGSGT